MEKSKLFGIIAIIPTILLMLWIIIFLIFGTLFGIGSGVDIVELLPFLSISIFQLIILIFSLIFSFKIIKNNSLSIKNNLFANLIIIIGMIYFIYSFLTVLYNNISGLNPGGEARPVIAFLWCLIFVSIGFAIKEKNNKTSSE